MNTSPLPVPPALVGAAVLCTQAPLREAPAMVRGSKRPVVLVCLDCGALEVRSIAYEQRNALHTHWACPEEAPGIMGRDWFQG